MIVKEIRTIRELEENLLTISQACYIAGPISGVKDYRERFNEGARFLEQYNIPAWNPGTHPAGKQYRCKTGNGICKKIETGIYRPILRRFVKRQQTRNGECHLW